MDGEAVRKKMQEVVDLIAADLGTIRTGRASPRLVEDLSVLVYGGTQRLTIKELGSITAPDPESLVIDPWDKSIIGEIRKGILEANVGLNPMIDGEVIRISLPPLTTEDREKYVKLLSTKLENGRIMIRQIRKEFMKEVKNAFEEKQLSEDEKFNQEKELQGIVDDFNQKIEEMGERKKQELLQI